MAAPDDDDEPHHVPLRLIGPPLSYAAAARERAIADKMDEINAAAHASDAPKVIALSKELEALQAEALQAEAEDEYYKFKIGEDVKLSFYDKTYFSSLGKIEKRRGYPQPGAAEYNLRHAGREYEPLVYWAEDRLTRWEGMPPLTVEFDGRPPTPLHFPPP